MSLFLAQVILAADSAIPQDVAVNTFHFRLSDGGPLTDADIITGQRDGLPDQNGINGDLSDLYNDISEYLGITIDPEASRIKWYNLGDPKPRSPFLELEMDSFTSVGFTTLPAEVACVSSIQGEKVSGLSQSRRRNRQFLGPLAQNTIQQQTGLFVDAFTTAVSDAYKNLASNSRDAANWQWVVNSPTTGENHVVKSGWVDNAPDSQRRRGLEATLRNSWVQDAGDG